MVHLLNQVFHDRRKSADVREMGLRYRPEIAGKSTRIRGVMVEEVRGRVVMSPRVERTDKMIPHQVRPNKECVGSCQIARDQLIPELGGQVLESRETCSIREGQVPDMLR